jgi:hypothetical protein
MIEMHFLAIGVEEDERACFGLDRLKKYQQFCSKVLVPVSCFYGFRKLHKLRPASHLLVISKQVQLVFMYD